VVLCRHWEVTSNLRNMSAWLPVSTHQAPLQLKLNHRQERLAGYIVLIGICVALRMHSLSSWTHCIKHLENKAGKERQRHPKTRRDSLETQPHISSDQRDEWSTHSWNGNMRHIRLGLSSEAWEAAPSPGKQRGSTTSVSGGG
jgi:hypothetical protein